VFVWFACVSVCVCVWCGLFVCVCGLWFVYFFAVFVCCVFLVRGLCACLVWVFVCVSVYDVCGVCCVFV